MGDCIVVAIGDMHTNSKVGLCPPRVIDDDGGEYRPNPFQKWLWKKAWLPFWEQVLRVRDAENLPVVLIVNGDSVDDNYHDTSQSIITGDRATMLRVAAEALEPALTVADKVYVIRGTPAHEGRGSWLAEALAEDISAEPNGEKYSWWHLRLNAGGVLFDVRHHPESRDGTPRTRGAGALRIAHDLVFLNSEAGELVPDVAIRSHIHGWRDSGRNHKCRAIILPAWQGMTTFIHRIAGTTLGGYGGAWFVCREGEYTFNRYTVAPKQRRPERVTWTK